MEGIMVQDEIEHSCRAVGGKEYSWDRPPDVIVGRGREYHSDLHPGYCEVYSQSSHNSSVVGGRGYKWDQDVPPDVNVLTPERSPTLSSRSIKQEVTLVLEGGRRYKWDTGKPPDRLCQQDTAYPTAQDVLGGKPYSWDSYLAPAIHTSTSQ